MKDILKKEYVYLDVDVQNQDQAFDFIAKKAVELGLVTSASALVKGYKNREAEGTTGFEDGFAIPHARIKEVKEAAVFVLRFKNEIDWKSMDEKPTKVAIALLIPDGPNGEQHLAILSDIAMKLMDENFKTEMKKAKTTDAVIKAMTSTKKEEVKNVSVNDKAKKVVAITSCITGIAHTYMAEEKLLLAGKEMGINVRVETQGSKGVGTKLTSDEINEADVVIIAADLAVDMSRFAGKKIYSLKVAKAMKDPIGTIKSAFEQGTTLVVKGEGFNSSKNNKSATERQTVMQHVMAGISYMIPVIVLGGICLAFSIGIAKAIWGPSAGTSGPAILDPGTGLPTGEFQYPWNPLAVMDKIGGAAFAMMIPILAGFIANSISGRAAIAPAMVAAFIGNNAGNFMPLGDMGVVETPAGFLGAIAAGLAAGYIVKWINTWSVPRSLQAAMPIFFIPIVVGLGLGLLFIYVIGGPIGFVMDQISIGFKSIYENNAEVGVGVGLAVGIALGAMAGFDMGGPINKIAFVTGSALVTAQVYEPMGAIGAAIPVAPLSMGLSTILFPKFFNKDEKGMGIAALIMGTIGISEGAIPFAIRDPKRAVLSNVVGSAVAGGIAGALGVQNFAAHGGPIVAILGAVPYGTQTLYFFLAVAVGVAVTTSMYGLWMIKDAGVVGSVKATHIALLTKLANEKRDAIGNVKEEMLAIKNENRIAIKEAKLAEKDVEKTKAAAKAKMDAKKAEIMKIKEIYKANVAKAKSAYKVEVIKEKEFVNSRKVEIKTFNTTIKTNRKEELEILSSATSKAKEISNKADKKSSLESIREEKISTKEKFQKQLDNKQITLRKSFVDSYSKLANA
ncbi:PTS fructose transporter subunit IIABC [Mesoplasma photuris]|uniref:PTS fructose transporter subunit IIABC n=1 Tax=Mesoplasma photuris TaxID=217731 RepID=UPI00056C5E40|nr:fructose-specific PTS transporter subunit EIIC [Mesoplasma photuris]